MRTKVLIVALIVSVGLNLVALGIGIHSIWFGKGFRPVPREPRIEQRLHLTREQRDTMKTMRQAMALEIEPLRRALDVRRLEILELVRQPEVDTIKRNKLFSEISDLQTQLELKLFQNVISVRNILTPDQQKLFFQPMEEEFQRRGGPFGPGSHHEGPPGPDFGRKPDLEMR